MVSIHNIMGTNIFQVDPLLFKELQGFVDVLQAVDPHTTPCGPRLRQGKDIKIIIKTVTRLDIT